MIHITDKSKCCGCNACVQRCPKQCITMHEDEEGFLYPIVDKLLCIDCGVCNKVCPMLIIKQKHLPLQTFAALNPNVSIRLKSSSGGVFSLIAKSVIEENGIVYGVSFDNNWKVIHKSAETLQGLNELMGAKYVQSNIGDTFVQIRKYLKMGRKVLFSGTPCQVAGLKLFLNSEYFNLLTVECVCHGVPSPGLWQHYLEEQVKNNKKNISNISNINFRNKDKGWKEYHVVIEYNDGTKSDLYHGENPWTRSFIHNLNLRPSCYQCPVKCNYSYADITIGDFWGIDNILPNINDNKGITLLITQNEKGKKNISCFDTIEVDSALISSYNKSLFSSSKINKKRNIFFQRANKGFISSVKQLTREPIFIQIKIFISYFLKRKKNNENRNTYSSTS